MRLNPSKGLYSGFRSGPIPNPNPNSQQVSAPDLSLTLTLTLTLNRFPLRTKHTAAVSEIKSEPYNPDAIKALLESFSEFAPQTLLFLRNVQELAIYTRSDPAEEPKLMFKA